MDLNKDTNINIESNNKSVKDNKNDNENNIEGEKKIETSRNELNTKSDINFNISNSFEDFEHKFQELKSKINQERSKDPKISSKFSTTTVENLNIKLLNDNSEVKSKINEIYAMINGNTLGKLGLIPNKPPKELNMNIIIKDIKKDDKIFYSKIDNNNNNINNINNNYINNNVKNFDYKNNNFKSINYVSPIKSSNTNENNNNNNIITKRSFGYSFSSEKKNPMIYNNKSNKKEYIDLFKPLTLKSIKMTSRNYPSDNQRIEIQIPKRGNYFNKKYFKSELDNLNNLLFGTTSYGKSYDNETIDQFYETKKGNNKRNKFLSEGSSFLNQFSRTKN